MDETMLRKVAYILGRAAALNATVAGMQAENQYRAMRGESPAYTFEQFEQVIADHSCHHNQLITELYH